MSRRGFWATFAFALAGLLLYPNAVAVSVELDGTVTRESGSDCDIAVYRFGTRTTYEGKQLDILLRVTAEDNDLGSNCVTHSSGFIQVDIRDSDAGDNVAYMEFVLEVVEKGTTTPVVVDRLQITGLDLDSYNYPSSTDTDDMYFYTPQGSSRVYLNADTKVSYHNGSYPANSSASLPPGVTAYNTWLEGWSGGDCRDTSSNPDATCRAGVMFLNTSRAYFRVQNDNAYGTSSSGFRRFWISLDIEKFDAIFSNRDFGDAPSSYGQAGLPVSAKLVLGEGLPADEELAYQQSAGADADDTVTNQVIFDDEEAVTLAGSDFAGSELLPGESYSVSVSTFLEPGTTGYLSAWVDWNRDGDFLDTGEHWIDNVAVTNNGVSVHTFDLVVPYTARPGTSYVRFIFSSDPVTDPLGNTGSSNSKGEVEDYAIQIGGHEVSGSVFEDIIGDALSSGQSAGDAQNPFVQDARVLLYSSSGQVLAETTTDASGNYHFNVKPNTTYYVVVDSKTIRPSAGAGDLSSIWAEQTYGAGGAWGGALCDTDADPTTDSEPLTSPGPCYGGRYGDRSDNIATLDQAEHVAKVTVGNSDVSGVDFGFSFNVVTNTNDQDDDTENPRTCQGCLRQFIQNANVIPGANAMRFVPAVPTNAAGGGGSWWQVRLAFDDQAGYALPPIVDDATAVDGTAYSYRDGVTLRDTNAGAISTPGTVGVSENSLDPYSKPELEIDVNDQGRGLVVRASNVEVKNLALFNSQASSQIALVEIEATSNQDGNVVENSFLGARADGSDPLGDDRARAGITIRAHAKATVRHNYVAHVYNTGVEFMGEGVVEQNFIEHIGMVAECGDGISFEQYPDSDSYARSRSNVVARYNFIRDIAAYGIESWGAPGAYTIEENTITDTGKGNASGQYCGQSTGQDIDISERGGIRIFGSGSLIKRNVIHDVPGHGVVVVAIDSSTPSNRNTITQNSFYNNGGISIDLDQTHQDGTGGSVDPNGDGVTPNNGTTSANEQNAGLDYPVISRAVLIGNKLRVKGYIGRPDSTSFDGKTVTVEIYKADDDGNNNGEVLDGDGEAVPHGEGRWYLGACDVTLGANGTFSCTLNVLGGTSLSAGDLITATATDADGNTSEFGANAVLEQVEPFDCSPAFYQVIERDLKVLDPKTGTYTLIGTSADLYNSIGWDVRNNLIYGLGFNDTIWDDHLLVIGRDGTAVDLGSPIDANGVLLSDRNPSLFAADMDENGYLYARWNEDLVKIDVDNGTYEIVDFSGPSSMDPVADIVYIQGTNAFWGVHGQTLYKWDLATRQVTTKAVTGLPTVGKYYGAAYTDNQGNLYVSNNKGGVYRIDGYTGSSPRAVFLVNSEPTNRNDGASCPSAPPPGFGVPVSGQLYHDAQPNSRRDPGEAAVNAGDLGISNLYVKLFEEADGDCSAIDAGTATEVASVDASGAYRFNAVPAGTYCLVLDDNNDAGDKVFADLGSHGWLYISPPTGVRALVVTEDQVAVGQELEGNDYGLFHGARIEGVVFRDTGEGGGTANDAVQNGGERGVPEVEVTVADGTRVRSTLTDAEGRYTLYVPADWDNVVLSHGERPASGYNQGSGGVQKPNTWDEASAGASPAARVDLGAAGSLAGSTPVYNFGVVFASAFRPDQSGSATSPGAVTYRHTYKPGTLGTVTLGRAGGDYVYQIRVDANCDGDFEDAGESWKEVSDTAQPAFAVTGDWPRNPDGSFKACAVEVRVLVPDGEPEGAVDIATFTASLAWSGNADVVEPVSVTDTTTVRVLGTLRLEKLGRVVEDPTTDTGPANYPDDYAPNVEGQPGDVLEYCIAYRNVGSDAVSDVVITDPVPFFTDPLADAYGPGKAIYWKDAGGTVRYLTSDDGDDAGAIAGGLVEVQAEAALAAGEGGLVCYRVQIR